MSSGTLFSEQCRLSTYSTCNSMLAKVVPYAVMQIHDILVWIRIRGSMPLTNRSGSCYFRHWPSRSQQKTNCLMKFFRWLLFEGIFRSFFIDIKSKRSHKTIGIKVFLTIFAWRQKDPYPYLVLMYPDPGGPKTYGSGSATLPLPNIYSSIITSREDWTLYRGPSFLPVV